MREISVMRGVLLGLLSALLLWAGLPGGGEAWPVLFIALVPLLFLVQAGHTSKLMFLGMTAGFIHFCLQLYWIVIVLGRYGGLPWFFSVPAYLLLSLYMAVYVGVFVLFAAKLVKRVPLASCVWIFPALWVGLDWLRSLLFSGFPWMDLGYGLWQTPLLIQTADLLGHRFITYLLLVVNCLIYFLLQKEDKQSKLFQLAPVVILAAAVLCYGQFRTGQLQQQINNSDTAVIGVVQGNIDQSRKWSADEQKKTVDLYIGNTKQLLNGSHPPELVVWPETALPFFPMRSPYFSSLLLLTMENKFSLLTGSPWFEVRNQEKREIDFFNSAFVISPGGNYADVYFKSHLVPFGEYVPLKRLLPFLAPLVENVGDFTPGIVGKPLTAGKIKSGVLICFESIFPEITRKWILAGANVLVNLTNDAWYGRSSAPSQSMAMSVFRAVESRRSLVRAANTGISGFVEPTGRVRQSSDIFVAWAQSGEVHLLDSVTIAVQFGHLFGPFCVVLVLLALFAARFRRKV